MSTTTSLNIFAAAERLSDVVRRTPLIRRSAWCFGFGVDISPEHSFGLPLKSNRIFAYTTNIQDS